MKYEEVLKLEEKIYKMSNSFLPLDLFFNDIRDKFFEENFDKDGAYKDIEKIADFINDLLHKNEVLNKACEILAHDLATYEWQGNGRFARSEEIIFAETLDQAEKEVENE